jgi:hypothetical protein
VELWQGYFVIDSSMMFEASPANLEFPLYIASTGCSPTRENLIEKEATSWLRTFLPTSASFA